MVTANSVSFILPSRLFESTIFHSWHVALSILTRQTRIRNTQSTQSISSRTTQPGSSVVAKPCLKRIRSTIMAQPTRRVELTHEKKVELIRASSGQSQRQLADQFGIGKTQVLTNLKRKAECWSHSKRTFTAIGSTCAATTTMKTMKWRGNSFSGNIRRTRQSGDRWFKSKEVCWRPEQR